MEKENFLNGYCLEYACALKKHSLSNGKEYFICGITKGILEEGVQDCDVYEAHEQGFFKIIEPLDILHIEVSHFFLVHKNDLGHFILEDVNGVVVLEDLIKNASFSVDFENVSPKAIIFEDEIEAESFSSEIEYNIVEEIIKELISKS